MIGFTRNSLWCVVFGAQAMSMTMGLGFAMAVDPQNGVQVPVVAQLYVILGTLLFLAVDGHLALINAVVQSYDLVPVGSVTISRLTHCSRFFGFDCIRGGILLALPVMTALLLINLAFGIITRTAPQLNIFAVGFHNDLGGSFHYVFGNARLPGRLPTFSVYQ